MAKNGSHQIVMVPMSQASTPSGRVTMISSSLYLLLWSAPGCLSPGPLFRWNELIDYLRNLYYLRIDAWPVSNLWLGSSLGSLIFLKIKAGNGPGDKPNNISGEITGAEGAPAPPLWRMGGGGWAPLFLNVYTFQYALHNKKKPRSYCQKASETLSESRKLQIFLGEHAHRWLLALVFEAWAPSLLQSILRPWTIIHIVEDNSC